MLSLSRWLVVCAGVVVGLSMATSDAQAFGRKKAVTTTYYDLTPANGCIQPVDTITPVTVTTARKGLLGRRVESTVTYGPSVPVSTPYPTVIVPSRQRIIIRP